MLKYGICSHNVISVNIVYLVGPIFDEWISDMIFENQCNVSNVYIFNIESRSLRQLFYTHNTGIEPLIVQKHQTVTWSSN